MREKERVIRYFDCLAKAIKNCDDYCRDNKCVADCIETINGYAKESDIIRTELDRVWESGPDEFVSGLEDIIDRVNDSDYVLKVIQSYEICKWMDSHIGYRDDTDQKAYFSINALCRVNGLKHTEIGTLNSNYKETCIWINPKFGIRPAFNTDNKKKNRSIANRDVFNGLNGTLAHISYMRWDGTKNVRNIILPPNRFKVKEGQYLRIGFAPFTDEKDFFKVTKVDRIRNGISYSCEQYDINKPFSEVEKRLSADINLARKKNIDILFFPEMVGTKESCGKADNEGKWRKRIDWLTEQYEKERSDTPYIVILPSYWHEGSNSSTIALYDGKILGIQEKHIPYRKKSDKDTQGALEGLKEYTQEEYIIIHIPDVHRIAVVICAEFLEGKHIGLSDLLCGELGVSLIIIPSFSNGEQDFINALSSLTVYDTSIVWGNCCGPIRSSKKGIGGCSIAGSKIVEVFGKKAKCGNTCEGIEGCVFVVDLPLKQPIDKLGKGENGEAVNHFVVRKKRIGRFGGKGEK